MVVKKIDIRSGDALPAGLDLDDIPLTQSGVHNVDEVEYITLNPHDQSPWQFKANTGNRMCDLAKSMILTRFTLEVKPKLGEMKPRVYEKDTTGKIKVDATTGEPILAKDLSGVEIPPEYYPALWRASTKEDNVAVINGLGSRFPKDIKLTINGQHLELQNMLYSYKQAMYEELYCTAYQKKFAMAQQGYYYNDIATQDPVKVIASESFQKRRDLFIGGKEAEFMAPLRLDMMCQDRFLLNNSEIEIEISPAKQEFMIYAPLWEGEARLKLTKIRLYMSFIELIQGVGSELNDAMLHNKAMSYYPFERSDIRQNFVNSQNLDSIHTVWTEQMPKWMCIAFVDFKAFDGDINLDPFVFINADLYDQRVITYAQNPYVPWELEYSKDLYARAYVHFLRNTTVDNGITMEMFKNTHCLYPYILTSTREEEPGFDLIRDGATSIHSKFRKAVGMSAKSGLQTIIWGRFDAMMTMDQARSIRMDYTV